MKCPVNIQNHILHYSLIFLGKIDFQNLIFKVCNMISVELSIRKKYMKCLMYIIIYIFNINI